ncbi:hypothetical protein [Beggiatoa leptomitoformis]|uniref:Uncharacterized protein n=1 Tax=Beggiatoa leptomitoformis TaxID=288004 RepID=A0A2N9YGM2_9GAMM|nr:hypothetical protein [Beggiatoa leptomitoformis]ALG68065.1 hypothetical protein AL038_10550 [Beggiatoa leptomitoformis]AUI69644.1 hypothetical protein BLE401_13725 [Beggiatoa leptomitoformis]
MSNIKLSDQALSILKQMKSERIPSFITLCTLSDDLVLSEEISISEPRFLNDDLNTLVANGFLTKLPSTHIDSFVYSITRQGLALEKEGFDALSFGTVTGNVEIQQAGNNIYNLSLNNLAIQQDINTTFSLLNGSYKNSKAQCNLSWVNVSSFLEILYKQKYHLSPNSHKDDFLGFLAFFFKKENFKVTSHLSIIKNVITYIPSTSENRSIFLRTIQLQLSAAELFFLFFYSIYLNFYLKDNSLFKICNDEIMFFPFFTSNSFELKFFLVSSFLSDVNSDDMQRIEELTIFFEKLLSYAKT